MSDKELFNEVFNCVAGKTSVTMSGTLVCVNGEPKFNTDGYTLAYNLHRLTNLLEEVGVFY